MLVILCLCVRLQANFGMCYVVARAYALEQQNAGRDLMSLHCHWRDGIRVWHFLSSGASSLITKGRVFCSALTVLVRFQEG